MDEREVFFRLLFLPLLVFLLLLVVYGLFFYLRERMTGRYGCTSSSRHKTPRNQTKTDTTPLEPSQGVTEINENESMCNVVCVCAATAMATDARL